MKLKELRQVMSLEENIIICDNNNDFVKTNLLFKNCFIKDNDFVLNSEVTKISAIELDEVPYIKVKINFTSLLMVAISTNVEAEAKSGFKSFIRLNENSKELVLKILGYYNQYIK